MACQVLLVEQHFTVCSFVLAKKGYKPEELSITTLVSLAALLHGRCSCNARSFQLGNAPEAT